MDCSFIPKLYLIPVFICWTELYENLKQLLKNQSAVTFQTVVHICMADQWLAHLQYF